MDQLDNYSRLNHTQKQQVLVEILAAYHRTDASHRRIYCRYKRTGAVLAQKFWEWVHYPISSSSPSPFSPFSEIGKIRLYIDLHLNSIVSLVANSVMSQTQRPVETRPEWLRGGGVLGRGQRAPSPSVSVYGERYKLPAGSGAEPRKIWILEHFGTSEITSEGSASF